MTQGNYEGGCQCGAVRYEVSVDLTNTSSTRKRFNTSSARIVAVNVNCLNGVDPRGLKSKHVDSKSL
jgi:hypothetical protein